MRPGIRARPGGRTTDLKPFFIPSGRISVKVPGQRLPGKIPKGKGVLRR